MTSTDIARYLDRLGLDGPGSSRWRRPGVAALRALHAAHVERVPFETLDIHLGRPTAIDPRESVERVLRGRGGYCFHLNGAFATLLAALGYDVTWHRGGVHGSAGSPPPGANANHLTLTVDCEDRTWFVDVGLGDALYEPLPLGAGAYRQEPFTFRLGRSEVTPGGWRLTHDAAGSFAGMDFDLGPAVVADFEDQHRHLSTSPDSGFTRVVEVIRRDAIGVDMLRGLVLRRVDADGVTDREILARDEWYELLAARFGLCLDDVGPAARAALWDRVRALHDARSAAS